MAFASGEGPEIRARGTLRNPHAVRMNDAVAAEREACAQIADRLKMPQHEGPEAETQHRAATSIADAIRARGNPVQGEEKG